MINRKKRGLSPVLRWVLMTVDGQTRQSQVDEMINLRIRRLSAVFLVFILSAAFAIGAAFEQPRTPAFGKPDELINLVIGFQPYYAVTWTAAIARDKARQEVLAQASASRNARRTERRKPRAGPCCGDARREVDIGYIGDVARYLNVVEKTIYRLAQTGELPGFKVAGTWRFQRADIRRWIDDRKRLSVRKER